MNLKELVELIEEHKAGSPWKEGMIFYVDVDDTIIDHNDLPIQHVIDFLEVAKGYGCVLYLCSQGGEDYCREIAEKLGITSWFRGFLPKPDVWIDDIEITSKFITGGCYHPKQLIGVWKKR